MRYMLKAMCYDSDQARQRFPRLLQIVEMYPDTVEAFVTKVSVFFFCCCCCCCLTQIRKARYMATEYDIVKNDQLT